MELMSDQQLSVPPPKLTERSFELSSEKLIGYVLLVIGILIIAAATYMVLEILTGKSKPPKVFNVEALSFQLPSQPVPTLEIPDGASFAAGLRINQEPGQNAPSVKLIPEEVFNGTLNIGLYYLAMMFLSASGAKIAGIGVKMIKDIKVQIKEEKIRP